MCRQGAWLCPSNTFLRKLDEGPGPAQAELHSCGLTAHSPVHISPKSGSSLGPPGDPMFLSLSPALAAHCLCCPHTLGLPFRSYQLFHMPS